MTLNKFWLVWNEAGNAPKKPHDTKEKAIAEAKRLSAMYPQHAYVVLEATHHFKADVNVVETYFEATSTETPTDFDKRCTPKHDFKVGDRVKYKKENCGVGIVEKIDSGLVAKFNNGNYEVTHFAENFEPYQEK
jgi:hypothetical protein